MNAHSLDRKGKFMNRKITLTGANIVFFIFAMAFTAYQVVLAIIFGAEVFTDHIYLMLLVNELGLILAPVLIYAAVKRVDFKETFRFNKPGLLPVLLILLLSLPAYFVASMLNNTLVYFLQFIGRIPSQPIPVPDSVPELLLGLLVIAVLPGVCEEMMHRGLLLRAYERRGSYRALAITSVLFGLFHFDLTNLLGPVFLGLIIGYYVLRTNSIFAGMLAHFLNNAIAELLQYFSNGGVQPEYVTITAGELGQVLAYGFVGLIVTGFLLGVFNRATERAAVVPPISSAGADFRTVISHWPILVVTILYFFLQGIFLFSIIVDKALGQ